MNRMKNIPANDAHRLTVTCDSMPLDFNSCIDKLFGEFTDVKRKICETNDHILLPDSLDARLVEKSCRPLLFVASNDCCWLSSTRRAVTRFFDTFGVKI